jgi:hypothetical protein
MEMLRPWTSSLCPPSTPGQYMPAIHSRTIHHDPLPHLAHLSDTITCYSLMLLQPNPILDGLTSSKARFPMNGPSFGPNPWDLKPPRHVSAPLSNPDGTTHNIASGSLGTTKITRMTPAPSHNTNNKHLTQEFRNNMTHFTPIHFHSTSSNNATLTSHKKNFFFYHPPSAVHG